MVRELALLWKNFTPVEKRLLSECVLLLPVASREKLEEQIQCVNYVQRLLNWTEIDFYSFKNNKVDWTPSRPFNNKSEIKIAEMDFLADAGSFSASFNAVGGYIFSLIIRPSIKRHAFCQNTLILKSKLIQDPDLLSQDRFWFAKLPDDYIDWLELNRLRESNGWLVCGKEDVYQIHLSDADYAVLAVRDDEFLLANVDGNDRRVYYFDGAQCVPISSEFANALSR